MSTVAGSSPASQPLLGIIRNSKFRRALNRTRATVNCFSCLLRSCRGRARRFGSTSGGGHGPCLSGPARRNGSMQAAPQSVAMLDCHSPFVFRATGEHDSKPNRQPVSSTAALKPVKISSLHFSNRELPAHTTNRDFRFLESGELETGPGRRFSDVAGTRATTQRQKVEPPRCAKARCGVKGRNTQSAFRTRNSQRTKDRAHARAERPGATENTVSCAPESSLPETVLVPNRSVQ